jgi:hypothetical protein
MWYDHSDASVALLHIEAHGSISENRFLYEKYSSIPSTTRQKMLRPLIDKVPAQVRETDEVAGLGSGARESFGIRTSDTARRLRWLVVWFEKVFSDSKFVISL